MPQILSIYDAANLGVTGAGQTIAILIDATPLQSDLAGFYSANGLPASTINNVTTINVNNTTITKTEGEETLDVEWTSGVAPGAKIRVYSTGDLQDASLDRGLARILSDAAADATLHQLSISLGGGETFNSTAQFTTDAQYFAALASQGVSTFVSAGDSGSAPKGPSGSDTLQVEYFSSDPSVTGVGGTAVRVDSSYTYDASTAETVWGPYTATNGATGGGGSIAFKKPSWQTGAGVPGGTMRYVPDVAMPADPYTGAYFYYTNSALGYNGASVIGGTSWSAPTWAGFCALINEARTKAGKTGGIGLLNPSLYPLIGTGNFHDITLGNNILDASASNSQYSATAGYDECTGVGTPDLKVLMNTLVTGGTTAAVQPTITNLSPSTGTVGTTITITGTNLANVETVGFYSEPGNEGGTTFTVNSPTQITVVVPPSAQTGPLTVTTPGGTASNQFTFTTATGAPTITGFSPASGTPTTINPAGTAYVNGTPVTITGTNFTNLTKVTFNGLPVQSASYNPTTINTYVSYEAITGPITVTTTTGKAVSAATFTVNSTSSVNAPTVTLFTPTSGPLGTSVTVFGTGFTQATGVKFNGTAASVVNVISDTQITVTVPGGATTGAISVTDSTGTGTSAGTYTVGSVVGSPDLTTGLSHAGSFTQADTGDTYTIVVNNAGKAATTGVPVTLTDTLPGDLTATAMSGTGWTCNVNTLTATRSDVLAVGSSYPAITLTVNVSSTAAASVTNTVTVSGGGETNTANDTASDVTAITALTPSQNWRDYYFGTPANSGNAADTANPAHDGIDNLLKYALNLDPTKSEASPVTEDTSTGYLRLTVPMNPNATDITYSVQATSDLTNVSGWTTIGTAVVGNVSNPWVVSDTVTVSGTAKRFMRLQVSR